MLRLEWSKKSRLEAGLKIWKDGKADNAQRVSRNFEIVVIAWTDAIVIFYAGTIIANLKYDLDALRA